MEAGVIKTAWKNWQDANPVEAKKVIDSIADSIVFHFNNGVKKLVKTVSEKTGFTEDEVAKALK